VLTHPFTAVAAYSGIGAFTFSNIIERKGRVFWIVLFGLAIPVIAWFTWPWFDAWHLLSDGGGAINEGNRRMYSYPYIRAFGALLAVPVVIGTLRARPRDPFALMFLALLGTYLVGAITGIWSLGRIMPFLALAAHVNLARWAVEFEDRVRNGQVVRVQTAFAVIVVAVMVVFSAQPALKLVQSALPSNPRTYERYSFLSEHIGPNDVVIATLETGWRVPAFAGKIVGALHPMPYVDAHEKRQRDVSVFFSDTTSVETRERILDAYNVRFILIDATKRDEARMNLDDFTAFGPVIEEDRGLILIRREKRFNRYERFNRR
jgi:alpha-1,6-mannosyltransferase